MNKRQKKKKEIKERRFWINRALAISGTHYGIDWSKTKDWSGNIDYEEKTFKNWTEDLENFKEQHHE